MSPEPPSPPEAAADASAVQDLLATPIGFAELILGIPLYDWQAEALTKLEQATGPAARMTRIAVRAPNGSGKSSGIVAAAALWWVAVHPRGKVVITSADGKQLDNQVWPSLERRQQSLDGWTWNRRQITTPTGGTIFGFVTDEAGRAEGWHKLDDIDGPLLIITDEAKSISETIFSAIDRCTFNALIVISSPGKKSGTFFNAFTRDAALFHSIAVGLADCPHIPKDKIDAIIAKWGPDHPFTKSTLHGEFMADEDLEEYIVDVDAWDRCLLNPPNPVGGPRYAFCDFGKGVAEHVIAIREGNVLLGLETWREKDPMASVGQFIMRFRKWQLKAEHIAGDEGGDAGAEMLKLLREAGWAIRRQNFGATAWNKDVYISWGSEAWHEFGTRVQKCDVVLLPDPNTKRPRGDDILRAQLTTRKHLIQREGKLALEDKHELGKRGLPSPDRADAVVGVFNTWANQHAPMPISDLSEGLGHFLAGASDDHQFHEPPLGADAGY